MNGCDYRPRVVASHIGSGTAFPMQGSAGPGGGRDGRVARVPKIHTELNDRVPATCFGGLSLFFDLWRSLKISERLDESVQVLRRHKLYHESDHVLAHTVNLFSGGTCIEDQAILQGDQAVLRMMGADHFPDPTTSGDFLRRFDEQDNPGALDELRRANDALQDEVWSRLTKRRKRRLRKLGTMGLVDLDSSIKKQSGNQKQGADFSYTGQWAYHPLLMTLANTTEILAVRNRPGNSASASGAAQLLDEHLPRVKRMYETVVVRGDSAFDTAEVRAVCEKHGVYFALVGRRTTSRKDKTAAATRIAENDWEPWLPPARRKAEARRRKKGYRARRKGRNLRRQRALARGYLTKTKVRQWVAEVSSPPSMAEQPCRVIIIREQITLEIQPCQRELFPYYEHRLIVTNLPSEFSPSDVVDATYHRCDQENIIEQLGNELAMWRMPVREAAGNAAWIEMARLAWNMGKWLGLLALPLEVIRWEWKRFRRSYVYMAAEVLHRSRQVWVRLNPSHRYVLQLMEAQKCLR